MSSGLCFRGLGAAREIKSAYMRRLDGVFYSECFGGLLQNCKIFVLILCHFYLHGLPFSLATLREPGSQALGKTLRRHAKTRLHEAVADRQSVVKLHGIGEVAHAELIQPFQRTSLPCTADYQIYLELLRVHASILTLASGPSAPSLSNPWLPPSRKGHLRASRGMSGCATAHPTSGQSAGGATPPILAITSSFSTVLLGAAPRHRNCSTLLRVSVPSYLHRRECVVQGDLR